MSPKKVPMGKIFPDAEKMTFNEIIEGDVVGIVDRVHTGGSIRINIASQSENTNFWYRKNNQNVLTLVAHAGIKEIFLIQRSRNSMKFNTALQQESQIEKVMKDCEASYAISFDEIHAGDLLMVMKSDGTAMSDYAIIEDKFGWYTEGNMYLASPKDTIYRIDA